MEKRGEKMKTKWKEGGNNSKKEITEWMENALAKSHISDKDRSLLRKAGMKMIQLGYWRGDISERWKSLGFGSDRIHDLYL